MERNKIKIEISFETDENGEVLSNDILITRNGIDAETGGVRPKELALMYLRVMAVKSILEDNAKRFDIDLEKTYKSCCKRENRGLIDRIVNWVNGK